jgi:cyclohexanone monooxygenase
MRARFVVHGQRAAAPAQAARHPGRRDSFKGHSFHTSRWDYDYTGGDSIGRPDRPGRQARRHHRHRRHRGAVRAAPGAGAKELFVFQRTPSSIDVRNDRPTDPDWVAACSPAGRSERMDNFTT